MPADITTRKSSDPDDITDRTRRLFDDVDSSSPAPQQYAAPMRRRQNTTPEDDDLDTPPSLRYNDLRNIFTD